MLPAFEEENDITHIVSLHEERILVTYSDNSMAVLMLPSLAVVDRLPSSWLAKPFGDITVVYIDERNGRNFAYVGTTDGLTVGAILGLDDGENVGLFSGEMVGEREGAPVGE